MKIQIINRKNKVKAAAIGPVFNVMRGTPLGNPFNIKGKRTREVVIALYRKYLWTNIKAKNPAIINALSEIKKTALHNERIFLSCCCFPKACHAEIIKSAVLWAVNKTAK